MNSKTSTQNTGEATQNIAVPKKMTVFRNVTYSASLDLEDLAKRIAEEALYYGEEVYVDTEVSAKEVKFHLTAYTAERTQKSFELSPEISVRFKKSGVK
jgi:Tfp pilus assembly PilM family ATPase